MNLFGIEITVFTSLKPSEQEEHIKLFELCDRKLRNAELIEDFDERELMLDEANVYMRRAMLIINEKRIEMGLPVVKDFKLNWLSEEPTVKKKRGVA